jgi:hypothetical protein
MIVTPSIRKKYKDLIKEVVNDLHKPILVYLEPEKEDCPNCIYDALNRRSSGKFDSTFTAPTTIFGETISPQSFTRGRCPVCLGVGYLEQEVKRNVKALVKWNPDASSDLEVLPVGREGSAVVRIKVLRADFDLIMDAIYFLVDGVRCELVRPPTIRGLGIQEELVVAYLQEVEPGKDVSK